MGQRARILAQVFGFEGWRIADMFFERPDGSRMDTVLYCGPTSGAWLVLEAERTWAPRCGMCGALSSEIHARLKPRRWHDLPWADRPVLIETRPIRVRCKRCDSTPVEMLAWAAPFQRQTRRLQHRLALQAASMPVLHVAAIYGLSWSTVRRAEVAALARWDKTRAPVPLHQVGIDEKWLGRRHKLDHDFVTIVSNLETGEPVWIGPGRDQSTVAVWLASLTSEQKAAIRLVAMDMHRPYRAALAADTALAHVVVVHDAFHVIKRAGQAVDEVRRDVFFRAGNQMRHLGRGKRWLVLRAWERSSEQQQDDLRALFKFNRRLARAYHIKEELRMALRETVPKYVVFALQRILRRTQARSDPRLRGLHDCIREHWDEIVALAVHHPPTGRIEALNNNWETLVRRARGYRNHDYLLLKLKFATANPIRSEQGVLRFLALGLPVPLRHAA